MRASYTPWARSALGDEARARIKWHLARGLHLDVGSAVSPYRFTVRLFDRDWVIRDEREAMRENLFNTIIAMLIDAGEPLPTEAEWNKLKDTMNA